MNLDSIIIGTSEECWLWTGQKDRYGYGKARPGGGREHIGVHRFVYELAHGPISSGLTVDHLCENKLCQNPAHLEAVPAGANALRSAHQVAGQNARKERCPKCGGEYSLVRRGEREGGWKRTCRPCRNAYEREWRKARA